MSAMRYSSSGVNKPIREIAYETLKHAIITGEIPAGVRIVETEYANKLHISRTPLREALRKLERDGLVEYVIRRGVVVRAFTIEDVEEIYTIRNALEMITLPAIIQNATPDDIKSLREKLQKMDRLMENNQIEELSVLSRSFHDQVTAISGLKRILHVIQGQDEYIHRFSALSIAKDKRRKEAHQEHHRIVELIENHDLEGLQKLMQWHIESSKGSCLAALKETALQKRA
ncbi:MAG TPA: GntR family transcriptional regulator [Candidatus Limiplasma sp.]|nr:GntR family transcriptional regulator [Candidatus Limiplasma sp.]